MDEKPAAGKKAAYYKWPLRLGIALVIYTLVGFFVIPAIIKSQMLKRLPALTKRTVSIGEVKCNPYTLSLTIRGLALKEANGEMFSSFDEFYANFQLWSSLFKRSWVFDEISLKEPFARVTYQADGNFNFANLINNPSAESKPPQPLPALVIYNLRITNGTLSFDDLKRKVPFHTQFLPIDVSLTNLTTVRDQNSPYSFVARAGEGETFAWSGTVSINPLRSAGVFRLGNLQLGKYSTYSHDYARFEIVKGQLDVAADYNYDSVTNALDLSVSNALVQLTNLELKAPDTGETVIAIPMLSVTKAEASVARRTARVGLVKSSGGSILARQNQDGSLNLLSLLDLPKPATKETNAAPFNATIDEIAFDNYTIKAEDKKPAKPANFTLDQLGFNLKGVSNLSNAPVTASLSLRFQETGFITANGTATLLPPSVNLQIALTNLDLRALQPYVEQQIKLAITSGALDLRGQARYAATEPGAPLLSFNGDLAINKFATTDDVLFKDFAKWDALNVTGIKLELQPDKLQVDQVKFTGLDTSLIIGPDQRANLQTILRNQMGVQTNAMPTAASSIATSSPKKNLDVTLGALMFENASLHFADQSIDPHAAFDVQEFSGSIQGLSSEEKTTAVVDLKGNVDSRSPFSVTGKVNLLGGDIYADLTIAITNTELTAFTPYTEKFAGRPLQKGKVSFTVHYLVDKKVLKAENEFYVDQLSLGAKNNNPAATTLPVKLAIALLKDRHGRIQLDVPIAGRLDDPKFQLGPIIWKVVLNIITKAASSPFSLLGSMFGGGEELSFVNFTPGQAVIPNTETNKLEILSKALYERPELTVEINGSVAPAQDRAPLARIKLNQQLKSLWIKQLTDAGKPAVAVEDVQLEQKNYEALLQQAYKTAFGKFKQSEPATNQVMELTGQSVAPKPIAISFQPDAPERGAAMLFKIKRAVKVSAKTSPAASPSIKPAAAQPPAEPELADMEAQLLQKVEITDDDLRNLMNQRAAKVQAYLLQSGKVTADRLFITAPKHLDASFKGEDRVNLSLD